MRKSLSPWLSTAPSDYSVDPVVIGPFVEVHADLSRVSVRHECRLVAWYGGTATIEANIGDVPIQLYTVYAPVHHAAGKVQATAADA